jgi:hypothetical protein
MPSSVAKWGMSVKETSANLELLLMPELPDTWAVRGDWRTLEHLPRGRNSPCRLPGHELC